MSFLTATISPEIDIKQIPPDAEVRNEIRRRAAAVARDIDVPPSREELTAHGKTVLRQTRQPECFLGFAMVAVSNAFWKSRFQTTPYCRRLLLLPRCLSDPDACKGVYDKDGLHCARCGACVIDGLLRRAERLGYRVMIAEGSPSVARKLLDGDADAVLGVACLDSLEKAFEHVANLGIPHLAVPLLKNGCVHTEVELHEVLRFLNLEERPATERRETYLPLLRETRDLFQAEKLNELLGPYANVGDTPTSETSPADATEAIAIDWLRRGGKRLRPFITLAAYAVGRCGAEVLAPDADLSEALPTPIKRIALAVEAFHKASLVHDDIEDDDPFRYGRQTLHRVYGVSSAINIGDYLVGLGYRLVAGQANALGGERVADILNLLSKAHVELCCGQGAELAWRQRTHDGFRPIHALEIYMRKTSPAFEAALYAGLRAADVVFDGKRLARFCTYLGQAYQVLNDLKDWRRDDDNKMTQGLDVLLARPTLLRAFACEAGGAVDLQRIIASKDREPAETILAEIKALYDFFGVFEKTERFLVKLRERASAAAEEIAPSAVRDLLMFLLRVILSS